MAGLSRTKGQSADCEATALLARVTGFDVRCHDRQHQCDSDLEGQHVWSLQVTCDAIFRGQGQGSLGWLAPLCTKTHQLVTNSQQKKARQPVRFC